MYRGKLLTRILILLICPAAILLLIWSFSSPSIVRNDTTKPVGERLEVGETVPAFHFTDIQGDQGASSGYEGQIVVYSFADWRSQGEMIRLLEKAGVEIIKNHPHLQVTYLGIPDLTGVPGLLRGLVHPVLKAIVNRAVRNTQKTYRKMGLPFSEIATSFYIVPDWSGEYMKQFGLENARDFQCFITKDEQVVGVVNPSTTDGARTFIDVFRSHSSGKG